LNLSLWVKKSRKYNVGIDFLNIRSYGLQTGKLNVDITLGPLPRNETKKKLNHALVNYHKPSPNSLIKCVFVNVADERLAFRPYIGDVPGSDPCPENHYTFGSSNLTQFLQTDSRIVL
jgi:hypothetical protein